MTIEGPGNGGEPAWTRPVRRPVTPDGALWGSSPVTDLPWSGDLAGTATADSAADAHSIAGDGGGTPTTGTEMVAGQGIATSHCRAWSRSQLTMTVSAPGSMTRPSLL